MMKKTGRLALSLSLLLFFAGAAVLVQDADARAGGGRSIGGSGSRSSAAPGRSYSSPNTGAPGQASSQPPVQPGGGGFLRSMGGGILGGLLGGMLFSGLGFGGTGGGFGGSGIGLIEILLICGIGYWIFTRMTNKRREAGLAYQAASPSGVYEAERGYPAGAGSGPDQLRRMDPSLDEGRFKETAMDIFFKVQGCWTNRDLSAGTGLLTDDMRRIFQQDMDQQIRDKKINRLENIAVRKVEVVEAWQESGMDYVKALLSANLLDYTTDDTTGAVLAGSRTEPVKFEECWTYVRPIGSNFWKLTAISQV
jgi:predicted lipid-binding transport protein (Tim44 family)